MLRVVVFLITVGSSSKTGSQAYKMFRDSLDNEIGKIGN